MLLRIYRRRSLPASISVRGEAACGVRGFVLVLQDPDGALLTCACGSPNLSSILSFQSLRKLLV